MKLDQEYSLERAEAGDFSIFGFASDFTDGLSAGALQMSNMIPDSTGLEIPHQLGLALSGSPTAADGHASSPVVNLETTYSAETSAGTSPHSFVSGDWSAVVGGGVGESKSNEGGGPVGRDLTDSRRESKQSMRKGKRGSSFASNQREALARRSQDGVRTREGEDRVSMVSERKMNTQSTAVDHTNGVTMIRKKIEHVKLTPDSVQVRP
jgi:hypothetical protein